MGLFMFCTACMSIQDDAYLFEALFCASYVFLALTAYFYHLCTEEVNYFCAQRRLALLSLACTPIPLCSLVGMG